MNWYNIPYSSHVTGFLKKLKHKVSGLNHPKIDNPADTYVFRTSSGRLEKVATSSDQTRHCQDVWKKTSDLQRLEDV